MIEQKIIYTMGEYSELENYFISSHYKKIFLVCGKSISQMEIGNFFEELSERIEIEVVKFSEFEPNPRYESIVEGVKLFNKEQCDVIIAVGGGSAMDVSKCIKLFSNMDISNNLLYQKIVKNNIELIAVPTTAGTGSEATRFAVVYYEGKKQSISDESCIPNTVVIDPKTLNTLPIYHRKATMLDALCHAIESFWSINSTDESKKLSKEAIKTILSFKNEYLLNTEEGNSKMLYASNLAGKAINITQTTAGHAMCYKLTSKYGIAHGHAAALCVSKLWPHMLQHMDCCLDSRGSDYLSDMFTELDSIFKTNNSSQTCDEFSELVSEMNFKKIYASEEDYEELKNSVNVDRLKNNPVELSIESIDKLYHEILPKK